MPAAEGLYSQGKEGNALPPAVLCCSPRLPVKGKGEGIAGCGGSLSKGGPLERIDHRDVHGRVSPTSPVWDQNICRPPAIIWEEESALLGWAQCCCNGSVKQSVSQMVVATDSLSTNTAGHGVVSQGVIWAQAGGAWASPAIELKTQPIPSNQNELPWPEVES